MGDSSIKFGLSLWSYKTLLLRKNFIEEDNVTLEQLKPGTKVLLMNAIMGVFGGTIVG